MKVTALAILALLGTIGVALSMGYGDYQFVPAYGYGQSAGGFGGDGSFLMLIGFLFIILILFTNIGNRNVVNNYTGTGTFGR